MKRVSFLIIIVIIATATAMSQPEAGTFSIIPRVGVVLAKVRGNDMYVSQDFSLSPKYKTGATVGADFEYQITNQLALSLGAFYSQQGNKYDDYSETHDLSTKKWTETRDIKEKNDYVNVPLILSIYAAKNLAFKAGMQFGVNIHATTEMTTATFERREDGNASTKSVEKSKSEEKLKKMDFSIPVGVSYEYMNVILDARYNIGLTKVYDTGIDGKNSVFQFTVGYRFRL